MPFGLNVPPPVPQPNPGIRVPSEEDPIIVPPGPADPVEIDDPVPEPVFPVREPGTRSPPQLAFRPERAGFLFLNALTSSPP